MQRLNKKQLSTKEDHVTTINDLKGELEGEVESFNNTVETLWGEVEAAIDKYNSECTEAWGDVETKERELEEAIKEANSFRDAMSSDMDNYYDDKSEKWQEGERGEAFNEWKEQWGNELEFEEIEAPDGLDLDQPDGIDMPEIDAGDTLENLPDENEC